MGQLGPMGCSMPDWARRLFSGAPRCEPHFWPRGSSVRGAHYPHSDPAGTPSGRGCTNLQKQDPLQLWRNRLEGRLT